jgi:hypothetical protein
MSNEKDESCPCGSGKLYQECCKKEYDDANDTRDKLKKALDDPSKSLEIKELLKQFQSKK